jgi:hypothetical protein
LEAAFAVVPGWLLVQARIHNGSGSPVYVLDFPWRLENNAPVADAQQVYRFERDGTLRLLLGAPPLPARMNVAIHFIPFASRVASGAVHDVELSIRLPVEEYNPYFTPAEARATRNVTRLDLIVQVVSEKEGVRTGAAPGIPRRLRVAPVPVINRAGFGEYIRATSAVSGMAVVCEGARFARTALLSDPK